MKHHQSFHRAALAVALVTTLAVTAAPARAQGRVFPIVASTFAVGAGRYSWNSFYLPSRARVTGRFRSEAGGGVEVFVFDNDGFENWRSKAQYGLYYFSGKVVVGSIDLDLGPGNYHIVYSNTFSIFTNKVIRADIGYATYAPPSPTPWPPPLAAVRRFASVSYDVSHKNILALWKAAGESTACGEPETHTGVITAVKYDGDSIVEFTLKSKKGWRKTASLREANLSNADRGNLYTLISEGKRVRVKVYVCGSGAFWTAESVVALPGASGS